MPELWLRLHVDAYEANFAHDLLGIKASEKERARKADEQIISATCEAITWESQKIRLQVLVKLCRRARIPGEKFELGFFTSNGSSGTRRYVGIWYYRSNPQTVVWLANRDNPLSDTRGVFTIAEDGNLKVLDGKRKTYWSSSLESSSSTIRTAKLMDTGNLVVINREQGNNSVQIVWQSFENPTDTFLPGMKMSGKLALSSWKSYNDPATGNFTFQQDQEDANHFVIWKRSRRYWKSEDYGNFISSDEMASAILYLLSNFTSTAVHNDSVPYLTSSLYTSTRLVMSFSGQIQYLMWDSEKVWSLIWADPRDRCSVYNACGNFGSCNSKNGLVCKCLPGFKPSSPDNWNHGDYSGGCTRKSTLCGNNAESDIFLSLKMMKVGNPDSQFNAKSEMECRVECLNNCECQAYFYEEVENKNTGGSSSSTCWIWSQDVTNLQEDYDGGQNLQVRVAVSDIESTARSCGSCGTNLIPYPLSTGPKCGDVTYYSFHCNISTGQLSFEAPSGTYHVTSINADTQTFVIQANDADECRDKKFLKLIQSSPYNVTNMCNADPTRFSPDLSFKGGYEVEVAWESPLEPPCSSSTDCKDWPRSICDAALDGKNRCLCPANSKWDSRSLNCTQEVGHRKQTGEQGKMTLALIIAVTCISVAVLAILSSTFVYAYIWRRRRIKTQGRANLQKCSTLNHFYDCERKVKNLIESGRFKDDDTEGIDVPSFDLESILVATTYFSNANKLGQGGFGPVYKGKLPGGEEIAVKRLSSCSGQGLEEFKNEVLLIAKLQHRNLVRLLGYCAEGDEKMLIYEYMANKSLDSFIFDRKVCVSLDWNTRFNIILGIARGLLYLHQDSRLRVIHRDLKTSNILLSEEMNPKISDFGLARIFGGNETSANTNRVVGTYGYMSPEYALDGLFSVKSDVFSFGVVVIEIITGKRNTGFYQPERSLSLLGYAWHLWKEQKALDLLEQTLGHSCNKDEYFKCVNVGLLCVQEDPGDRPTMSQVVFMLGSETATIPTPKQPAFVVRRCPSSSSRASNSSSKPETVSNNELTVTLEDGR
ncbi:G-type lectin S-receptor-like serine/threonine-protein kinase At4g03230 isoform X2 [Rosa chinensis]|uniref:G-type lectin S-receptor-like serine/threonine-protein kinase At4g03230 isoform X2 n=1 Tax=Rosa chinensis TaxID=74649 RepID=UPI001AD91A4C|nr:G-type lectin S-receptor-like serine/threonine-protein kinase At4g03230 isoform X2 [Rosa chinensis]